MDTNHDIDPLDQAAYETVHNFKDSSTGKKGAIGIAAITGMKPSTVQNKASRTDEYAIFNIKEMRSVMTAAKDFRMLEAMNRECGFAMTPLPDFEAFSSDMDLLAAWADWQSEIAETVQKMKSAIEDGEITAAELHDIKNELTQDYEKGLELWAVFEGMAEPEDNVTSISKVKS